MGKGITIVVLCLLLSASVYGANLDSIKVIEKAEVFDIHIFTDAPQLNDFSRTPKHLPYSMIVIDLYHTRHNRRDDWIIVNKDDLLRKVNLFRIRSSQYTKDITRVVLDVEKMVDYTIVEKENSILVRLNKRPGQIIQPKTTIVSKNADNEPPTEVASVETVTVTDEGKKPEVYEINQKDKGILVNLPQPQQRETKPDNTKTSSEPPKSRASLDSVKVQESAKAYEVYIYTDASEYRNITRSPQNFNFSMIIIDFPNTRHNLKENGISVINGNLLRIRSGQFSRDVARFILDIKKIVDYKILKKDNGVVVCLPKLQQQSTQLTRRTNGEPHNGVVYSSRGKRDPFSPLVDRRPKEVSDLLDVEHAKLTGIMWSPSDRYALIKDNNGKNYILREGDKISNGNLVSIGETEVVFRLKFGKVKTFKLEIRRNRKE